MPTIVVESVAYVPSIDTPQSWQRLAVMALLPECMRCVALRLYEHEHRARLGPGQFSGAQRPTQGVVSGSLTGHRDGRRVIAPGPALTRPPGRRLKSRARADDAVAGVGDDLDGHVTPALHRSAKEGGRGGVPVHQGGAAPPRMRRSAHPRN